MSEEKSFVDLEELKKKSEKELIPKPTHTEMAIQSIAVAFIKIAESLERIASALEGKNISKSVSVKPTPAKKPQLEISLKFPEDLRNLLQFKEEADKIVVKPRQFLGAERFSRIREIVVNLGGRYVSAGKDSHFEVPK